MKLNDFIATKLNIQNALNFKLDLLHKIFGNLVSCGYSFTEKKTAATRTASLT